jgi:hypothetical protein
MQHLSGGENLFRLGSHKLLLDSESHPNATAAATTSTSNHRLLLLLQPKKRAPRRRSAAIVQKPEPRPVTSRRSRCNTRSRSSTDQGRHRKKNKNNRNSLSLSQNPSSNPSSSSSTEDDPHQKKQILYSNPSTKNSPEKKSVSVIPSEMNTTKKRKEKSPRSLHKNSSRKNYFSTKCETQSRTRFCLSSALARSPRTL